VSRQPVHVPPRWLILPAEAVAPAEVLPIRLCDGVGFGDGTHPTTRVCLQALAALAPRDRTFRLLDFGSGSGILAIAAAAHLGGSVDAVEIDPRAIEHAKRNVHVNGVGHLVRQLTSLDDAVGPFDFIVANIARAVLSSFAEQLVSLLAPGGALVLSGLVSTDVPEVSARYMPFFAGERPERYDRDEWRALVWRGNTERRARQ